MQEVNVGQADGYQMVKSGEIAATILIAGKPTGSFGKFKLEPGMTLLPVPYTEALEQDYFPAKLTNDDYPNLIPKGSSVDTVAVGAVLAVYNWPREHGPLPPRRPVHRRLLLQVPRVPEAGAALKWREANLASTLRGWRRFPAAEEWLAKNPDRQAAAGPVQIDPAIVRAQAAKAAPNDPAEQERLFQQFMEWAKSQKR